MHQLDEVRQSIETQGNSINVSGSNVKTSNSMRVLSIGQAIVSMLSQLIHVISNGRKSPEHGNSGTSRIDEAITATIREIGIPQENV